MVSSDLQFTKPLASERWWYGTVVANYSDFKKPQDLKLISKAMHADHMKILKSKYHRFVRSLINPKYKKEIVLIEAGDAISLR